MFSRSSQKSGAQAADPTKYDSPLDELCKRLDRLDSMVEGTKQAYLDSISPKEPETPKQDRISTLVGSLKKLRKKDDGEGAEASSQDSPIKQSPAHTPRSSYDLDTLDGDPIFIPMSNEDQTELIELLRRIAELVCVGERVLAKDIDIRDKIRALGEGITDEEKQELESQRSPEADLYTALFDEFFERNGLASIVNIVTGKAFRLIQPTKSFSDDDTNDGANEDESQTSLSPGKARIPEINQLLLPPVPVATQAIQSVSILVQNVSRATSLYFILSNNHINQLIDFPLEDYKNIDQKSHSNEQVAARRFASPEISELTTHFVTFLKSLALRMNAETLQFYLTYPGERVLDEDNPGSGSKIASASHFSAYDDNIDEEEMPPDELSHYASEKEEKQKVVDKPVTMKEVKVHFPLYARALEFCAAYQDSFIRTTAMNICLNTLRLATVQPIAEDEDGDDRVDFRAGSSPDGVLHNAAPLPFRERLAIAQHVCTPSRVERLVSPIFTKLAQLWGMLEEQFREIGSAGSSVVNSATAKIAKAKQTTQRQKLNSKFQDIAYKLQDELELLEDVLKVGLTSLNEQTIEMMLATFVYPLLLQPLLLYFQRSEVPDKVMYADPLNDHTAGRQIEPVDYGQMEKSFISAPSKSAFFMLTAVFSCISNQPLLKLLFGSIFHPLSPDTTGEVMIRAKADVACIGPNGKKMIRVDRMDRHGNFAESRDRSTYLFGTVTGEKLRSSQRSSVSDDVEKCVFVLSPALAEVLEMRGDNLALIARTRHNPYRKAVFQCFLLSHELSDLRPLSVLAVDAAVSCLSEKFVSDMLLGVDLQRFRDNMPLDERKLDSKWAAILDDRGIGGPATPSSRLSLGAPSGGKVGFDFRNEVLLAFRSCLMNATPASNGTWKLDYDEVAAHALLCSVRANEDAFREIIKGVNIRRSQAAAFLSDMPQTIQQFLGTAWTFSDDPRTRRGMITDVLFYKASTTGQKAVVDRFLELKPVHCVDGRDGLSLPVCAKADFKELCRRSCSFPPTRYDSNDASVEEAMLSTFAWTRLDVLASLLKDACRTEPISILDKILGGFTVKEDGRTVSSTPQNAIYGCVSKTLSNVFRGLETTPESQELRSGKSLSLVGKSAIPCVCEAPHWAASLFSHESARVIAEGVTWQSLYVVLLHDHMILVEPDQRNAGSGRIVTASYLPNLEVKEDEAPAVTAARRLFFTHSSRRGETPGLFLLEDDRKREEFGPFYRRRLFNSSLELWFEDQNAARHAFVECSNAILLARANRGGHIHAFLAAGGQSDGDDE